MIKESLNSYLKHIDPVSISIAIIILLSAILAAFLVDKLIIRKSKISAHEKFLISKIVYIVAIFFSGFIVFHELGLHIAIVVSTLSVIGISFGVAGKDIISSFISGITLVGDFDIKIGDLIEIENKQGIIENIGLLYTNIRLINTNALLKVPNSQIAGIPIQNYSFYDYYKFDYTYVLNLQKNKRSDLQKILDFSKKYSDKEPVLLPKTNLEEIEIGIIRLLIKKESVVEFITLTYSEILKEFQDYNIVYGDKWEDTLKLLSWQYQKDSDFFIKSNDSAK